MKLAQSRNESVHQLFACENDKTRLDRYRALTKAGVVWEQVARRQHHARKRTTKRRRGATSPSGRAAVPKRRRAAPKRQAKRRTRKPASVDSASKLASLDVLQADDASSVGSGCSVADSIVSHSSSDSTFASLAPIVPAPTASGLPIYGDFDMAIDAIVGSHDVNASANVDEFTSVIAQLDAASPPLFEAEGDLSERLLALDTSLMVDSLAACDWDCVGLLSPVPVAPKQPTPGRLTVCM